MKVNILQDGDYTNFNTSNLDAVSLKAGDVFDCPPEYAAGLIAAGLASPADKAAEPLPEPVEAKPGIDNLDPADYSIGKMGELAAGKSRAELVYLIASEKAGKNRKGALLVLEDALAALEASE